MPNIRKILLLLLAPLMLAAAPAMAQEIKIEGDVSDGIKEKGLDKAVVKVFDAQTRQLLASDTARLHMITESGPGWKWTHPDEKDGAAFSIKVAPMEAYLLRIEAEGFEPYEKTLAPSAEKKSSKIDAGSISLFPKVKERHLDEVTVKATKIKFFYKGDTLIYNADAFNVEQSESLRKLVEQLPGAEITDGVVKVNGKPIANLLISGKDFFNGNIKAALDNLPAYIVKNVKVYNKAGELTELTGRDMHDESYVMDVHIKKQYLGTWVAKLEADLGTDDFYGAQAMAMRFDDRQSLYISGDINNFSKDRRMYKMSDTESEVLWPATNKVARLDYNLEPSQAWRLRANASVQRRDEDRDTWTNTETYLSPNNMMQRSGQFSSNDNTNVDAFAALRYRKSRKWQSELGYGFNYNRARSRYDMKSISYFSTGGNLWDDYSIASADTISQGAGLLYMLLNPQRDNTETFTHKAELSSAVTINGSVLNLKANLKHNTTDTHRFENYRLAYFGDGESSSQRRFYDLHDYALNLDANADYIFKYGDGKVHDGNITPYIGYEHDYGTSSHPLYRLERLQEWSNAHGWGRESLGILPEEDFRSLCIDEANSYSSLSGRNRGTAGGRISHKRFCSSGAEWLFEANAKLYYEKRTLDYTREHVLYPVSRDGFFFTPTLSAEWKNEKDTVHNWLHSAGLQYGTNASMPELTNYLPIRDNSDPLNLFLGNANLNNTYEHYATLYYATHTRHSGKRYDIIGSFRRTLNTISTRSEYDATTGVRTYTPENTNRTAAASLVTMYSMPLGKSRKFYISASLNNNYMRRANLTAVTGSSKAANPLLESYFIRPSINIRGTIGKLEGSIYANYAFEGVRSNGSTRNTRRLRVESQLSYKLPWDMQLQNYLSLTKNYGGSSAEFNRVKAKWNASLSKTILDGKLTVRLSASDILGKSGYVYDQISEVSRTETRTNVMPRYFMLSLISNLTLPKKKKE